MADKVVCTVSKRKEITKGPMYLLFRQVLRESCQPCPYFASVQTFKTALVDHALEQTRWRKAQAANNLGIHRNNLTYLEKTLPVAPAEENPIARTEEKVGKMYELMAVMEREKLQARG